MADETAQTQHADERATRLCRRQALIDAGIDPYPIKSAVTWRIADIERAYGWIGAGGEGPLDVSFTVAGRVRALRRHGKLAFIDCQDATGTIQLFCRINTMDEAGWALLDFVDMGDIVEASGHVIRTNRGQLSIAVEGLRMLSKAVRPLPEKFHGLSDREVRYRQRYVDLIMNPEVKETFVNRSKIISAIRRFMEGQGYLEVETPILQETLGGANARPFTTHFNALDQDCYLRIATELHLKRCIVGGMERVFEIGRQFRNEGMDLTHNPEFTSMEAYCAYSDLEGMKQLSEALFQACAAAVGKGDGIEYQGTQINFASPWRSATVAEIASEACGCTLTIDTPVEELRELCAENGIEWVGSWGAGRLLFELYDELGEKTIVDPTFVCDYPVEVSPLTKRKDDDPRLTDRFELIIAGHEYANAFSELNDPVDQESRFLAQVAAKAAGDDEAMEYDADYIRALEYGMPPAGGIGYGIDRMIMLFCDQASIRDVLLFPHMRPEAGRKQAAVSDGLETGLSRDRAYELLKQFNDDPFHIAHGETLKALMRYFAGKDDPANVEFWGQVGLLHDLDWEQFQDAAQHTVKAGEIIAEAGGSPELIHAIQTHNSDNNPDLPKPESKMEKWLYTVDELSGLIQAVAKMRPSGSVADMEVKSLKKKFKTKAFAAGCNRDIIAHGAELLGMELDEVFTATLDAMKAIAPVGDIYARNTEAAQAESEGPAAPQIPQEGIYIEPLFADQVDFNTFSKSDFRVVKIKACEEVPKSKKLLKFTLDDGTGTDRTILSGIKDYYAAEQLVGKTAVAITNLPPRTMMGIDSCGMLISALHTEDGKEALNLLMVDDAIPAGAKLY
ncbi:lysine--tRNA ligase [Coriobacteriales bacterium OH1046]|nr:lysine--tRNA ligase [Coriobacteriales bacterium OH1046]